MRFVISSGHGKYVRGASGYLDEVDEARRVVERVADYMRSIEVEVTTYHDDVSTSQNENLNRIVDFHNSKNRDYDVSVHFNAYQTTSKPMGTECLYVTQSTLAASIADAISLAGHFIDRGPKKRTDLFFLNNTEEPAVLIETCFVDSRADADLYHLHFEDVCRAIAEALSNEDIDPGEPEEPEEPEPPEPPIGEAPGQPAIGIVAGVAPGDMLNIRASYSSSATVIGQAANGDRLSIIGQSGNWLKLEFRDEITVYGWASADYVDVTGTIPGPAPGAWHSDITTTVFGGSGDEQEGAYGNYITGSTRGVALPYKWRETPRPRVVVEGPKATVTTDVVDVGPWNIDDPDYVLGDERPLSETQYEEGTVAQNGQVPSNDAGIDLTEPIAREVGISGKGKVSWRFEEDTA